MMRLRSMFALAVFALCLAPTFADASPPSEMPIQAYLTDQQGTPIDSTTEVRVALYPSASGGKPLHAETFRVTPDDGAFTAYLGTNKSLDMKMFQQHDSLFLGLKVGSDPEMTPRLRLATAPYAAEATHARRADEAETLRGKSPSDFAPSDYEPTWKDVRNRPSGTCKSGELMIGLRADGTRVCRSELSMSWGDIDNKPSGKCSADEFMTGYEADGTPICKKAAPPTWTDIKKRPSGTCKPGEKLLGFKSDGSSVCKTEVKPTWSDVQNKPSGQCKAGKRMVGYEADGTPICKKAAPPTWTDIKKRPSGRCKPGEKLLGFESDGSSVCKTEVKPTWSDVQNRPSGRCKAGKRMVGYNASGTPICKKAAPPTWTEIKNRPSEVCSPGEKMVGLKADGTPVCQLDRFERSLQSVQTGKGLKASYKSQRLEVKLHKGGVRSSHIGAAQVGKEEIAEGAIRGGYDKKTDNEIRDYTIEGWDMAGNSIGTRPLADDAVKSEQLASDAVGSAHLSKHAVGSKQIAPGAVSGGRDGGGIANETITGWDVKNNSLGHYELKKGSVRSEEIQDHEVGAPELSWTESCGYYVNADSYEHIIPSQKLANRLPNCLSVPPGSFCQSDPNGPCGLREVDNVGSADVWLRLE